jgi:Sulfotransferase domain
LRPKARHGIETFCRNEVGGWIQNITSYLKAADAGFPVFFVSYERVLENPAIVLAEILRWSGVQPDPQIIEKAVANMQFANLRAMEMKKADKPASEKQFFFRRGQTGGGRDELSESLLREIRDQTAAYLNEANRRQMNQRTDTDQPSSKTPKPPATEISRRNKESGPKRERADTSILPYPERT